MFYVKNLPAWERLLRISLGVLGIGAGMALWPGPTGWLVAGACAGAVLSGVLGYCPMCAMVGRRPLPRPDTTPSKPSQR